VSTATDFLPGEPLRWSARANPSSGLEIRTVRFVRKIGTEADVAFGLRSDGSGEPNVFRARLAELHRIPPPPEPAFKPAPARSNKISAPSPEYIARHRAAVAAAIAHLAEARDTVMSAHEIADRARAEVEAAHAALAELNLHREQTAEVAVAALRAGRTPTYANGHDRGAVEHRVGVAEAALDAFDRELATANAALREAEAAVRSAALRVVSAIADREGAALAEMEDEAARRRAELRAVDAWLTGTQRNRISTGLATLLANPPGTVAEPVGYEFRQSAAEYRTAGWRDLLDRLTGGDPDADLAT
jgi:hypothetical protein